MFNGGLNYGGEKMKHLTKVRKTTTKIILRNRLHNSKEASQSHSAYFIKRLKTTKNQLEQAHQPRFQHIRITCTSWIQFQTSIIKVNYKLWVFHDLRPETTAYIPGCRWPCPCAWIPRLGCAIASQRRGSLELRWRCLEPWSFYSCAVGRRVPWIGGCGGVLGRGGL